MYQAPKDVIRHFLHLRPVRAPWVPQATGVGLFNNDKTLFTVVLLVGNRRSCSQSDTHNCDHQSSYSLGLCVHGTDVFIFPKISA